MNSNYKYKFQEEETCGLREVFHLLSGNTQSINELNLFSDSVVSFSQCRFFLKAAYKNAIINKLANRMLKI